MNMPVLVESADLAFADIGDHPLVFRRKVLDDSAVHIVPWASKKHIKTSCHREPGAGWCVHRLVMTWFFDALKPAIPLELPALNYFVKIKIPRSFDIIGLNSPL